LNHGKRVFIGQNYIISIKIKDRIGEFDNNLNENISSSTFFFSIENLIKYQRKEKIALIFILNYSYKLYELIYLFVDGDEKSGC
jgi:hypothetical protein